MSTRSERQDNKALNEKHAKILKELMKRPENRKCADCRKRDPRWASWNLGLFMCIRCSGIHRSLGVHISKVKSADLDTWTPEQVENMIRWGNYKANLYWEKEWPADMDPPESNIEQWIRAKYERKQYAMKGPLPDPDTLPNYGSGDTPSVAAKTNTSNSTTGSTSNLISVGAATASQTKAPTTNNSASQQLFAAFGSAPPTSQQQAVAPKSNPQDDLKKNILSLYNSSPSSSSFPASTTGSQPAGQIPPTVPAAFASFASFPPPPQAKSTTAQPSFAAFPGSSNQSTNTVNNKSTSNDLLGAFSSLSVAPTTSNANTFPISTTTQSQSENKSSNSDLFGDFVAPAIRSSLSSPSKPNPSTTIATSSGLTTNGIHELGVTGLPASSSAKSNNLFDTFGDFANPAVSSPSFAASGTHSSTLTTPKSTSFATAATTAVSDFDGFGDFASSSSTSNNNGAALGKNASSLGGGFDSFGDFKTGPSATSSAVPAASRPPLSQQSSAGILDFSQPSAVKPVSVPAFKGFDDHNVWS